MGIVLHDPRPAFRATALGPDQPRPGVLKRNWKPLYWLGAGLLLFVLQLLDGTAPPFAALVFLFAVLTYFTVKTLGGVDTFSGILVTYLAAQHILISQVAKVCFWQPADGRLTSPFVTIGAYTAAMGALWLAAVVSNWTGVGRRRALFTPTTDVRYLYWLAIASSVLAIAQRAVLMGVGGGGAAVTGGILGPINTLVFLPDLAIASGTAYMIRSSQGRRTFGPLNGAIVVVMSFIGVLGTTRVAILGPIITYLLTCVAFRFRFRVSHLVAIGVFLLITQRLLFPLALMGRSIAHNSKVGLMENWGASFNLLVSAVEDPSFVPKAEAREEKQRHFFLYYGRELPELDRYSMIIWADASITATLTHGTLGMTTIEPGFEVLVPRFIQPDKPFLNAGNLLAHRIPGWIPKSDVTTGISLGFIADCFSSFSWAGVAVIPFLIGLGIFNLYRFIITAKVWYNVWAVSLVLHSCWSFSEATIDSQIITIFENVLVTAVVFWLIHKFARACERLHPSGRVRQLFDNLLRPRTRYSA